LSTIKSFSEQVDEFSQYYVTKPRATWYSNSTLFVSWFGINDIQNGYSPGNWSIVGPELVNRYFELVESLYSLGARNFVFLEVPPIWLTPALLAQNATEQVNKRSAVDDYNSLIQAAAHSFHVAKTDATVWLVNTAQPFETALDDPEAFGAPDATCYNSNGISCFWWNDFHPGAAIHKLVAEAISVKTGI
jgi:phospholipase/lecithinase/hemolysin